MPDDQPLTIQAQLQSAKTLAEKVIQDTDENRASGVDLLNQELGLLARGPRPRDGCGAARGRAGE